MMNKKSKIRVYSLFCILSLILMFSLFVSLTSGEETIEENLVRDYDGNLVNASEPYVWKRTENTEILKNPDGTMTRTIGQGTHFVDDKTRRFPNFVPWTSDFFPVINSTYKDYEYQLDTEYSDYEAYFQDDIKAGKGFRFEVNDYWFTYDLSGGKMQWAVENKSGKEDWGKTKSIGSVLSSSPEIYNNSVRYNNSFSQTDVQYEMRLDGVKENFVLNSMPLVLPGDYAYLEYTGELQFDNNLTIWANGIEQTSKEFMTSGSVDFKDENGTIVFKMPSPTATDSVGNITNLVYDIKPDGEKLAFGLKVPSDFLENAVYPVYIDPTIQLQTADTYNMDDAYVRWYYGSNTNDTNYGSETKLSVWEYGNPQDYRASYFKFNISSIPSGGVIKTASINLYKYSGRFENFGGNLKVHHVYNWTNSSGSGGLDESTITWNNQPCGSTFTNTTYCNLTVESTIETEETDGIWQSASILQMFNEEYNSGTGNLSILIKPVFPSGQINEYNFYSKEHLTVGLRPFLNVTYNSITSINSPSPAQTFTQDAPTTLFNITNSTPFDTCYAELDGAYNLTLSNSGNDWTLLNTTMIDGSHTVIFKCNETSGGEWHDSESVSFDVDSVNVTVCRDLTVTDREYELLNEIIDLSQGTGGTPCISIQGNSSIFDMNGYTIDGTDEINSYAIKTTTTKNITIKNGTLTDWGNTEGPGLGAGINLDSDNSSIENISISSCDKNGIEVEGFGNNLTNLIISGSQYGVHIGDSGTTNENNTLIKDSNIGTIRLFYNSYNTIALNTSYTTETIDGGDLTRKWYFDANVTDSLGNPLENVDVNITNITGTNVFSTSTDASGDISRTELIEYVNTGGVITYATPHIINLTHNDYIINSTSYNLTIENNLFVEYSLTPNLIISLNTPIDTSTQTTPLTFNCSATTSGNELANLTLRIWNSTGLFYNITNSTSNFYNVSINSIDFTEDGTYTWNCLAFNNISESRWASSNYTVLLSTISPAINLNYPDNNSYLTNGTDVSFNFTATDPDGLDNCTLYGDFNGTWLANYTWVNPTNDSMNWTTLNLLEDEYHWTIWCNDSLSNSGFANDNRTVTIDETYPFVNITSPLNASSSSGGVFTIGYNLSDTNLDICYFTLRDSDGNAHNYAENTSMTNCSASSEIFSVLAYGTYTFYLYGKDKAEQINTDNVTFTLTAPSSPPPSGGGGGGAPQTTTVIGVIPPENFKILSDLQRAIIYARILEIKDGGVLSQEDKMNIQTNLTNDNIVLTLEEITILDNQIDNDFIDNIEVSKLIAERYGLLTSRIIIEEAEFQVIPQIMSGDTGFVCAEEGGEVQQYKRPITANKLFESCEVTKEPNFFIQTLTGEVKYISQDGEVDRTRIISLNLINYCSKIGGTGIKVIYIVILGAVGLIIVGYFIYKRIKKKRRKR